MTFVEGPLAILTSRSAYKYLCTTLGELNFLYLTENSSISTFNLASRFGLCTTIQPGYTEGMEVTMEMKHRKNLLGSRLNARDVFRWKMCVMEGKKWNGARGVFSVLPACWGGGGAGCRHTTSAPPQELGSASQTASPAPAPRPAGRPYSHTAPFTR